MYGKGIINKLYIISMICLLIFPFTFLMMPFINTVSLEWSKVLAMAIGILFWFTGIVGYGLLILINIRRKKKQRRTYICTNKITKIADTMFLIAITGLIIFALNDLVSSYWWYVSIFAIAMSWNIHWLFSRNYWRKSNLKELGGTNK